MNPVRELVRTDRGRRLSRNHGVVVILCGILLFTLLVSMNTGQIRLSPFDTLRTLFGGGSGKENLVLFQFRLPRIVISILVGAGLSISGRIIQAVLGNSLADPGLLGIHAGAGFAVTMYVLFLGTQSFLTVFTMPFIAMAGGGVTSFFIYILAYARRREASPVRLILVGVALQAGLTALTTVTVVRLDETQYNFVAAWQAGTIWGANWNYVMALLPWIFILGFYVWSKALVLDVLSLGEEVAGGLGISVSRQRIFLLSSAVALAGSCVAVGGGIGFVGLIAPHLAAKLVGSRHQILLPVCALTGSILVLAADTVGRTIVQPSELPAGLVTAVIGAPYFLYLLRKRRN